MSNLTEQQECKVWDDMTKLAKSADKKIRQLAKEVGADYDYVRGVLEEMLDADYRVPKYYVVKKSRDSDEPYMGPTWDKAGLKRFKYCDSKTYIEWVAERLSKFNPAGFEVKEVLVDEDS